MLLDAEFDVINCLLIIQEALFTHPLVKEFFLGLLALLLDRFLLFPDADGLIQGAGRYQLAEFGVGPFHLPHRAVVALKLVLLHPPEVKISRNPTLNPSCSF